MVTVPGQSSISDPAGSEDTFRGLSAQYARAVDERDVDLLLGVFLPAALVLVFQPPGRGPSPSAVLRGHAQISRIIDAISVYPKTVHLLESSSFVYERTTVSGSVDCTAHHHLADPPGMDRVMRVRYEDGYRRDEEGRWRMARRHVRILSREDRPIATG